MTGEQDVVSDLPDSLMDATTAPNPAATRPRCRHRWMKHVVLGQDGRRETTYCQRCHAVRDDDAAKRGRLSLRAGKEAERAIAKAYRGERTGHRGGPDDVVVGDLFIIQSKAGRSWWREAYWQELAKLPRTGGRIPTLVISDRPGTGHPRRWLVIRVMEDDINLHGDQA